MRWADTEQLGRSGFVQSRLHLNPWPSEIAEIEFHAPQYCVSFLPHRVPVRNLPAGFHYFDTLAEAKAWAATVVLFEFTD